MRCSRACGGVGGGRRAGRIDVAVDSFVLGGMSGLVAVSLWQERRSD